MVSLSLSTGWLSEGLKSWFCSLGRLLGLSELHFISEIRMQASPSQVLSPTLQGDHCQEGADHRGWVGWAVSGGTGEMQECGPECQLYLDLQ